MGIALIAMGEEIGAEMALRTFGHLVSGSGGTTRGWAQWEGSWENRTCLCRLGKLGGGHPEVPGPGAQHPPFPPTQLRYGEPTLRRAVPLALALISVSNPRLNILDTLSKFSHDADPEVSYNSIFAMGMVGSGKPGRHPGAPAGLGGDTKALNPNFCLLPLFSRYQQRPAGCHAAAARPVPRQGPQQPLHGAASPGDGPTGQVGVTHAGYRRRWSPCGAAFRDPRTCPTAYLSVFFAPPGPDPPG